MSSPSKKKTVSKKKMSATKKKILEKTSLNKEITFNIGPKYEMDNIRLHFIENILHLVKSIISGDDLIEIKIRLSQFNEHLEKICKKLSPFLKNKGLFFVGIDIIGNFLTVSNLF